MKTFTLVLCVFFILYSNVGAKEITIENYRNQLEQCLEIFKTEEEKCSEKWRVKCYNHLMKTNEKTQRCYKNIAVDLFKKFYNLSEKNAINRFDEYSTFINKQYFFIFAETNFCKNNNCGISLNLYSEYATTQQLYDYVNKIINSISSRI